MANPELIQKIQEAWDAAKAKGEDLVMDAKQTRSGEVKLTAVFVPKEVTSTESDQTNS
jgi:hypothetical protein